MERCPRAGVAVAVHVPLVPTGYLDVEQSPDQRPVVAITGLNEVVGRWVDGIAEQQHARVRHSHDGGVFGVAAADMTHLDPSWEADRFIELGVRWDDRKALPAPYVIQW